MKVYIVLFEIPHEDENFVAVSASEQKANEIAAEKQKNNSYGTYRVKTYRVKEEDLIE